MEVVLLQRVEKLGQMGDVVKVRDGYGRNFLLPQGRALRATKANLARFETQRAQLEARNLELRKEAQAVADKLDGQIFVVIRQASDSGALYGSVSDRDISEAAGEAGFSLDRGQVTLDRPIKELGLHKVRVVLHPEVSCSVTVNAARSQDEAELQAQGKTIAELRAEEEAAEQADFDVQQLFETAPDEDEAPAGMEIVDRDRDDDARGR
jgi:large subunit ribosomal protein L9